jgi:hypothetical protein
MWDHYTCSVIGHGMSMSILIGSSCGGVDHVAVCSSKFGTFYWTVQPQSNSGPRHISHSKFCSPDFKGISCRKVATVNGITRFLS